MNPQNIVTPMEDEGKTLLYVVNRLMQKASSLENLGLYHGKIGIAIFFSHYAEYVNESLYTDFMEELLDEIYRDINNLMPIDIENGLSGIAWGIEYLIKQNFVDGDAVNVLQEVNSRIMEWDIRRIKDLTLANGLEGLYHYILYHLPKRNNCPGISFDPVYLSDLESVSNIILKNQNDKELVELALEYINWRKGGLLKYSPEKLLKQVLSFEYDMGQEQFVSLKSCGLSKGYAGIGMKIINLGHKMV